MPKLPLPVAPVFQPAFTIERARTAHAEGRGDEAIQRLRTVLRHDPFNTDAALLLGIVLAESQRIDLALEQFDNVLRIQPDSHAALTNRAVALERIGDFDAALAAHDRAVVLHPAREHGYFGRAEVLRHLGRFDEALAAYRIAEPLMRDQALFWTNLGATSQALGRTAEAMAAYDRAIALDPNFSWAWHSKACLLLLLGEFAEGLPLFEWRTKLRTATSVSDSGVRSPYLGPAELAGKSILLDWEQGLGDTIQFCRFASLAARMGARVTLLVQRPLVELVASVPGVSHVIADGEPPPAFDLRCSLLSLPLAFGITLATLPAEIPYLRADPREASVWRDRLSHLPGRRVGLVWAGGSHPGEANLVSMDQRRSIHLELLAPLSRVEGCSFVSVQLGPAAARIAGSGMTLFDPGADLNSFADTAALIENLDLVISVDTSVAHLAGALGKEVWLLNRFDTCWRWMLDRDDTPWYPTMRLFRQPGPGDWRSVVRSVTDALRGLAAR